MEECSGEKVPVDISAIYIPVMSTYLAWRVNLEPKPCQLRPNLRGRFDWQWDCSMAGAVEGVYVTKSGNASINRAKWGQSRSRPSRRPVTKAYGTCWYNVVAIQGILAQMAYLVGCRWCFWLAGVFLVFSSWLLRVSYRWGKILGRWEQLANSIS